MPEHHADSESDAGRRKNRAHPRSTPIAFAAPIAATDRVVMIERRQLVIESCVELVVVAGFAIRHAPMLTKFFEWTRCFVYASPPRMDRRLELQKSERTRVVPSRPQSSTWVANAAATRAEFRGASRMCIVG
jgi:hypothetical protein